MKINLGVVGMTAILCAAAADSATITGLYNTGVDDGGTVLAQGVADPHYVLAGGTATTYNIGSYVQAADATYIAADAGVLPGLAADVPDQDATYIAGDAGGSQASTNPAIYTLTFSLAGLDPNSASISGLFSADNHATAYLNGTQIAHTDTFSSFTSFSATSGFLAGANTLSFSVLDDGAPSAFEVSALHGTASLPSAAAVPEPATWAMMLGGFGLVGGAMRRRQRARVSFG